MKNMNNFTQWKNGSVDVMFRRAITQQKHLVQSGHTTWSAVDIFNTLCVFTKEPIRGQEINLESMNGRKYPMSSSHAATISNSFCQGHYSPAWLRFRHFEGVSKKMEVLLLCYVDNNLVFVW